MVISNAQSPLDEDTLYPCRWSHCGNTYPSVQTLRHHLDDHAAAATVIQLGGRKRRKLDKGMWMLVGNQSQGDDPHIASQAGNTTTTTTTTDPNTSASQALGPPSFPSLPPRPIFTSPPASPPSPDAAQLSTPLPMPSLAYDTPQLSQAHVENVGDSPFLLPDASRPRANPFVAHSPFAQHFRQALHASGTDGIVPQDGDAGPDLQPSQGGLLGLGSDWPATATDAIGKTASEARTQPDPFSEYLHLPSPEAQHTPASAADDVIETPDESDLAPSQSPFIPPTQAFAAGISLITSTPLEQVMEQESSGSMDMDLDSSLDMPVEGHRGAHTGGAIMEAVTFTYDEDLSSSIQQTPNLRAGEDAPSRPATPPLPDRMMHDRAENTSDSEEEDSIAAELFSTPLGAIDADPPILTSPSPVSAPRASPRPIPSPANRSPIRNARVSHSPLAAKGTGSFGLPMTFGSALASRSKTLTAVSFGMGTQAVRHNFGGTQDSPSV